MSFTQYCYRYMDIQHEAGALHRIMDFIDAKKTEGKDLRKEDVEFFGSVILSAKGNLDNAIGINSLDIKKTQFNLGIAQAWLTSLLGYSIFLNIKVWGVGIPWWDATMLSLILLPVCLFCFQAHNFIKGVAILRIHKLLNDTCNRLEHWYCLHGVDPNDPYQLSEKHSTSKGI